MTMPPFDQEKFEHWCRLNTVRQLAQWLAEDGETDAAERVVAFAHEQGWVEDE